MSYILLICQLFSTELCGHVRSPEVIATRGDSSVSARQEIYLRVLRTLPSVRVHFGAFLSHAVFLPLASDPKSFVRVIKTQEKGTDVSLASHLLADCFQQRCEAAVIVSNDSDLAETVVLARHEARVIVGVINPRLESNPSRELSSEAIFIRQLKSRHLIAAQFPRIVRSAWGEIKKPDSW